MILGAQLNQQSFKLIRTQRWQLNHQKVGSKKLEIYRNKKRRKRKNRKLINVMLRLIRKLKTSAQFATIWRSTRHCDNSAITHGAFLLSLLLLNGPKAVVQRHVGAGGEDEAQREVGLERGRSFARGQLIGSSGEEWGLQKVCSNDHIAKIKPQTSKEREKNVCLLRQHVPYLLSIKIWGSIR